MAGRSDVHLRSASGIVATHSRGQESLAELSRTGRPVDSLRKRTGIHAHRVAADHGASVRWLVGVSDDWVFRGHQPIRDARGFHGIYRSLPPGGFGRAAGLDARAFST